ncbi:MAG: dihydropteroate synthase [Chthoniobacterales bacterium]
MRAMRLLCQDRVIEFPRRPLVMGIINLNDDSFSSDGTISLDEALARARQMVADGADIIDAGGESARTDRVAVTPEEEVRRVRPFVERFLAERADWPRRDGVQLAPPLLSVNTWRPEVAGPLLAAGAELLNDMGALPDDTNARLAAGHGAALLIMHSVGAPKVAHTHVAWRDVVAEELRFFAGKMELAVQAGLPRESMILDPGLDFAKQRADNLRLLNDTARVVALGRPVLMPVSRKTVIGEVLGLPDPRERDPGTWACVAAGVRRGVAIFRVHAVREAASCVKVVWEVVQRGD